MDTIVKNEPDKHRYSILVAGEHAGHVDYTIDGSAIVFRSTHINEDFRGGGYGSILVGNALDDVRHNSNRTLVPECPFTKAFVERHPEYEDLLHRS